MLLGLVVQELPLARLLPQMYLAYIAAGNLLQDGVDPLQSLKPRKETRSVSSSGWRRGCRSGSNRKKRKRELADKFRDCSADGAIEFLLATKNMRGRSFTSVMNMYAKLPNRNLMQLQIPTSSQYDGRLRGRISQDTAALNDGDTPVPTRGNYVGLLGVLVAWSAIV